MYWGRVSLNVFGVVMLVGLVGFVLSTRPPIFTPRIRLYDLLMCLAATMPVASGFAITALGHRNLPETRARQKRAWYQQMYPHEGVRCGYDVRYCAGPNCPECGDPLGENQGKQAQATSGLRTE